MPAWLLLLPQSAHGAGMKFNRGLIGAEFA
jgi:hypothetical protein